MFKDVYIVEKSNNCQNYVSERTPDRDFDMWFTRFDVTPRTQATVLTNSTQSD